MSERAESTGGGLWADADDDRALRRYRALVEAVDDGIYQLDADGRFAAVDDGVVETTGYTREELLGEPISIVVEDECIGRVEEAVRGRAADGEGGTGPVECSVRTADGGTIDCELRSSPLVEGGTFRGTVGTVREVAERARTDRTPRERELEGYETIVETIPDGAYVLDEDQRFRLVNETFVELTGHSREELLGASSELVSSERGHERSRKLREGLQADEIDVAILEEEVQTAEGDAFDAEVRFDALYDDDGEFRGTAGIVRNISERKRMEEELRESEEQFRQLAENVEEAFWMTPPDKDEVIYVNPAYEEIWGRDRERLYEEPDSFLEAIHPDDRERVREALDDQVEGEYDEQYRVVRPDGTVRWVRDRAFPIEDEDGEVYRIVGIAADVTERKEFEAMLTGLQDSSQRFLTAETKRDVSETIVDAASDVLGLPCVACYRPDGDVLIPAGSAVSSTFTDQRFPELSADGNSRTARTFREGEIDYYDEDAEPAEVRVNSSGTEMRCGLFVPVGEDGVIVAGACESGGIDDRRRRLVEILAANAQSAYDRVEREQYVRDAKAQLEAATEAGAVGTWEWHVSENRFVTGPSFARTFGVDPDAAREGVPLEEFVASIHEGDRDRVRRKIEAAIDSCGEYEAEYRVRDASGELRWVVARGHVECDDDGSALTFPGALADITERKRAEEELETHKRQLETLFEVLPVGVVVADRDGRLVEANRTVREIWGGDVFDAENVADYDRYRGWWAETGEPVDPDEWTMARVLEGESVTEPDLYEIEAADGERRTVMIHGMPIRDESGEVSRGVVTQTDITERREYRRRLEESNERLEQFAYAASHDLQEPLRMVSSYLQLLDRRYGDELGEDGREFVEFAVDGAERMKSMIEALLEYSRVETRGDPFEPIDLDEVLEGAKRDLGVKIAESGAEITADGLPRVEGDAGQLRQVFQNLLDNAIEYSGDEPPRIHVSAERDGDEWVVSVRDQGIGIDPDDADRIFEVFQRLHGHEEHEGTGIGLALCRRIVERHGGEIWVGSEPGEGATISFTLPAA